MVHYILFQKLIRENIILKENITSSEVETGLLLANNSILAANYTDLLAKVATMVTTMAANCAQFKTNYNTHSLLVSRLQATTVREGIFYGFL